MCEAELFPQGVPIGCSPVRRPKISDLLVPVFRLKDRYSIAVKGQIENGGVRACPQECCHSYNNTSSQILQGFLASPACYIAKGRVTRRLFAI